MPTLSISRLAFVLLVLLAGSSCIAQVPAASSLQIQTDKGAVRGAATSDGKVIAFKGIPFGRPPVGNLRWQPPQPAVPWAGVRSAETFGYHCVQSATYYDMVFHDTGASEDCLNLNVWVPAGARPGSLPVMVWIYGGGYVTGGTSEHRQDGQFLAHKDVVVVSMNYRLGIFGFLAHPELTAESEHHASGNYGLMDQALALEWVRDNITAFGGDPHNVTLFGESAGSFAVSTLMASPVSKDLFQRAIGESGGAFSSAGLGYKPLAACEQQDVAFLQAAFGTTSLAELRRISTEDIVRAVLPKASPPAPRFGPDIDGYFLPESVEAIYAAGKQAHVPLIAGWNAGENRNSVVTQNPPLTAASFKAQLQRTYPNHAAEVLAVYPAPDDATALNSAADLAGDQFIAFSTWRWLEAQVATGGAPVYHYYFDLGSPGDRNHSAAMGAFHSDEIEYVFGALDSRPEAHWRPEDRALSAQMMSYWTNFARTGDPNGPGLPSWPVYGPPAWQTMQLDAESKSRPDPYRARYLVLDSIRKTTQP
jgi:para-nitrobenzyl esterase